MVAPVEHWSHTDVPVLSLYIPIGHGEHAEEPVTGLYVPWLHAEHADPSEPLYPTLHLQAVAEALPSGHVEYAGQYAQRYSPEAPTVSEYFPSAQLRHVETLSAPTVVEYFPAPHKVHAADPAAGLYVPATQAVHGPPLGPVYAALHTQSVTSSLKIGDEESDGQFTQVVRSADEYVAAGQSRHVETLSAPTVVEYFPAPHNVHAADPAAGLYVPATQAVHGPPLGPVYAALHTQSVTSSLKIGDEESDGHITQWVRSADEYVAAGQSRHVETLSAPTVVEYFPAPHKVHATDPAAGLYVPATHAVHGPP